MITQDNTTYTLQYPDNVTSWYQVYSNMTLLGENFVLSPPPLDITALYYHESSDYFVYLVTENKTLNRTWVSDHSVCQPGDTYLWGFSGPMLLIFCTATALFSVLLVTLYWMAYDHSQADRYKQPVSLYRDVLDIALELRDQLGEKSQEMPGDELDHSIAKARGTIELDTVGLATSQRHEDHLRRREERETRAEECAVPGGLLSSMTDRSRPRSGARTPYERTPSDDEGLMMTDSCVDRKDLK